MYHYNIEILVGLKRALKENLMSLKRLSAITKIPYRSLQNYFGGQSRMPADVYVQICDALGVDNQYILKKSFKPHYETLCEAMLREVSDLFYSDKNSEIFKNIEHLDGDTKKKALASYLAARVSGSYDLIVTDRFKKGWRGPLQIAHPSDKENVAEGDSSQ